MPPLDKVDDICLAQGIGLLLNEFLVDLDAGLCRRLGGDHEHVLLFPEGAFYLSEDFMWESL